MTERWHVGYDDDSDHGSEYITSPESGAIFTIRWGCSCCKRDPDQFPLTAVEIERLNLAAAAPELLAALEDMRRWAIPGMNWTDEIGQELLAQTDAAIAKARGQEDKS
jgi:hypothetical protein